VSARARARAARTRARAMEQPAGGALAEVSQNAAVEAPAVVNTLTRFDVEGGGARLACPVPGCGRVFKTAENVRVHARCHGAGALTGVSLPAAPAARRGRFHCCEPGCAFAAGGKTLANLKSAVKHHAQRHAEKTRACTHPGCAERFAKAHQLNRHVKNAHGGTLCKCGVDCKSKHALRVHLKAFAVNARGEHAPASTPVAQPNAPPPQEATAVL
jgi:hypothetical protein